MLVEIVNVIILLFNLLYYIQKEKPQCFNNNIIQIKIMFVSKFIKFVCLSCNHICRCYHSHILIFMLLLHTKKKGMCGRKYIFLLFIYTTEYILYIWIWLFHSTNFTNYPHNTTKIQEIK